MSEAGPSKTGSLTSKTFDTFNTEIQGLALNATKLAAALPADVNYHRSIDPKFAETVNACSDKALALTNKLLGLVADLDASASSRTKGKAKLEDEEDVTDKFESVVVDILDQLFERVDTCLDRHLGRSKPAAISVKPLPKPAALSLAPKKGRLDPALTHASHLSKPQLRFKRKVDNFDNTVWRPSLKFKFNAQVPLGYYLQSEEEMQDDSAPMKPHPYRYEIKHISYPRRMFEQRDPIIYRSFDETPFTWIDTKDALDTMIDKLRQAQEIAVDLEHHSYRSFSGFLCLMQISTREEDFIIDTLTLREELEDLNEVFTDPRTVKVFHGAESDIVWLQQDFNLYVVNLFDTFHASKALEFQKHGLASLLSMYCDFVPDKRFQLADWRIRPLPAEMLNYARSDTHFLLYIYDSLRNALIDRAGGELTLVQSVLSRSEETALRAYEREIYDAEGGSGPGGWNSLAQKWNKVMFGVQLEVFRCVHAWRDRVAREEDESTRYVLPNHHIFQLAGQPPEDTAALLANFRPVPPLVRARAAELLEEIRATVKKHLSASRAVNGDAEVTIAPAVLAQTAASEPAPPSAAVISEFAAVVTSVLDSKSGVELWSKRPSANAVAVRSSLLEISAVPSAASASSFSTTQSRLFPSSWSKSSSTADSSHRYRDAVSRVHSNLLIAPSLPKPTPSIAATKTETSDEATNRTEDSDALPGQIEIPFVPASQRESTTVEVTDAVVVVGKARKKKRKRVNEAAEDASSTKESTPDVQANGAAESNSKKVRKSKNPKEDNVATPEDVEPFDYASAPNFLDNPPAPENETARKSAKEKGKGKKGRGFDFGNFRTPRANTEVKGGNRSHTFR